MKQVRSVVGLLAAALASAGCTIFRNNDVQSCGSFAAKKDSSFNASAAPALAGRYQLIMIAETPNEYSHSTHGPLELSAAAATSGGESRSVLSGFTQLSRKGITIPWVYDPSSRDAARPGLLVHANGDVDLGGTRDNGVAGVSMHIESVTHDGFGGSWTSVPNTALPVNAQLDPVPTPHGRFCALRRS